MINTLILYESKYGTGQKTAQAIGYVVGNTRVISVEEMPQSLIAYQNILFVFSFYGPETAHKTKIVLKKFRKEIVEKKLGIVGVGLSEADFKTYLGEVDLVVGRASDFNCFVGGQMRIKSISKEDLAALKMFEQITGTEVADRGTFDIRQVIELAIKLRDVFGRCPAPMEPSRLKNEIEAFICEHNMLALATSNENTPRCSPVEYLYRKGSFYIFTEGGLKFAGILEQSTVSFGIYNRYDNMTNVKGMQVTAQAEIIPFLSKEYRAVIEEKGIHISAIEKRPIDLYLIRLNPRRYDFLNLEFKKDGYDAKQTYIV